MLFPGHVIVGGLFNMICPIGFLKRNSQYFSCHPPSSLVPLSISSIDTEKTVSVTIQIPIYKENFETVIKPTLNSLIKCRDYGKHKTPENNDGENAHGINVNIICHDDGLFVWDKDLSENRNRFYTENNIGYIGRSP